MKENTDSFISLKMLDLKRIKESKYKQHNADPMESYYQ